MKKPAEKADKTAEIEKICNKINRLNQNILCKKRFRAYKKPAQHVVEFSLIAPFFVIVFTIAFQMMIATYSKYKFSYIFTNAVKNAVQYQTVFSSKDEAGGYDFKEVVQNALEYALTTGSQFPYTEVSTQIINTEKTTYLVGVFQYVQELLFFGRLGGEYFYFIIPINSSYTQPLILNQTTSDIEDYFEDYYSLSVSKNAEGTSAMDGNTAINADVSVQ